jgi:hypothetical protein
MRQQEIRPGYGSGRREHDGWSRPGCIVPFGADAKNHQGTNDSGRPVGDELAVPYLSCATQMTPDQARVIVSPDPVHRHGPRGTVGWLAQIAGNQDRLTTILLREIGSFNPAAMDIGRDSEAHVEF